MKISPIKLAKLIYGKNNINKMSIIEIKARNKVANNFIKHFKIKIK